MSFAEKFVYNVKGNTFLQPNYLLIWTNWLWLIDTLILTIKNSFSSFFAVVWIIQISINA